MCIRQWTASVRPFRKSASSAVSLKSLFAVKISVTQNAERPLREIEASAASLRKILSDVEKAELAQKLEQDILLVQSKIQDIDTKAINADIVSTLASIRNISDRTDLFLYNAQSDVSEILDKLNTVLLNLSEFSQKIRQNPSTLIRSEKKSGR